MVDRRGAGTRWKRCGVRAGLGVALAGRWWQVPAAAAAEVVGGDPTVAAYAAVVPRPWVQAGLLALLALLAGAGMVALVRHEVGRRWRLPVGRTRGDSGSDGGAGGDDLRAELRRADALLTLVTEHCREVIWVRDAETAQLLYGSPAIERVAGVPRERIAGDPEAFLAVVHPDDRRIVRDMYHDAVKGPVNVEFRVVRPNGDVRWMACKAFPVREEEGARVRCIAGISDDVTDVRAAQAAERRRHGELALGIGRSAMGQMASAVAHELSQPLCAIGNYAWGCLQRLESGQLDPEEIRDAYRRIAADAERSARLIRRLRDLACGRAPVARPEDLNALVTESVALAGPDTLPSGMEVALALDPAGPQVAVDRVQVQQVILNLVRNAVDAMADGDGTHVLHLSTIAGTREATVAVTDTGRGLDPASAGRLFEPFYTTKDGGLGMGLAISHAIVEAHGGRLWAVPGEGGGTVFRFSVPLAAPSDDPEA